MTLKQVSITFNRISNNLLKGKEKILNNFLYDMIFGIISSKSLNLSGISRNLEKISKTTSRHIHKRLVRNLGKFDLRMLNFRNL